LSAETPDPPSASPVDPDVESGGGVNEVMVEDVVRLAQRANMNREGRRLPVYSQLVSIILPPALEERQ
jgi:hypothetical protein